MACQAGAGDTGLGLRRFRGSFFFFWEEVARTDIFRLKSLIEEILRSLENPPRDDRMSEVSVSGCYWLVK